MPSQLISGLEACTCLEELHVSGQHLPPLPPPPPSQTPTQSGTSVRAPSHSQAVQLEHAIASANHSNNNTLNTQPSHNLTTTQSHILPASLHPPRSASSLGNFPRPAGPSLEFDPASIAAISKTLRVLFCKACRLTSCEGLRGLTSLRKLDLSHNNLAHLSDLEPLLRPASCLTWLDLRSNPLCRAPKYREGVTMMSDSLVTLDGEPILAAQREVRGSKFNGGFASSKLCV